VASSSQKNCILITILDYKMKKLLAAIIINLCLLPGVWAAITLSGQVVANHEAGSPVAGVRISAEGATSTQTDKDGHFALVFPNGKEGQPIEVKVSFGETDSLVNRFALIRPLSAVNSPPFLIILTDDKDEKAIEWIRKFYHQKIWQILDKQARPEAASNASLQNQLARHASALVTRVGDFRTAKKSNAHYNAAMRLLGEAKLDAALAQLDLEPLKKLPASSERISEETALTWQLRAQLLALRGDFPAAAQAYEQVRQLQPQNITLLNAVGVFHNIQGDYTRAAEVLEKILTLARDANRSVAIIVALQNSGKAQIQLKQYAAARKKFEEAVELASNFPAEGYQVNPNILPASLRPLLELNLLEKRLPEALQCYQKIVTEQRKLFKQTPDEYRSRQARDLFDFGKLTLEQGQAAKARLLFEESLQVLRTAKDANHPDFLAKLVPVLHALAEQNMADKRNNEAVPLLNEAIKHYRTLVQTTPEPFLPLLGLGLNQLATLYVEQAKLTDATTTFQEQLAIHRKLAVKDPANHLLDVADTLVNLATLHQANRQNDEARKALLEAQGIYQNLKKTTAQAFEPELRKIDTLLAQLGKNK
jgi:tetratricopeptide (TPR) repeat protein